MCTVNRTGLLLCKKQFHSNFYRLLKEQCHSSRIFSFFFLAFLPTSYGFILIKIFKLHYFYFPLYSETTNRGEITVTTTFISRLDLCIFPRFKYTLYRVSHHARPPVRAPSWILNLKTLAQRFQVWYVQKHMREI